MKVVAVLFLMLGVNAGLLFALQPTEGLVVSDKVRIRESPFTDSKLMSQVDTGAVLTIVGRSEQGEQVAEYLPRSYWYEVKTTKGNGYIWGGFFWPIAGRASVSSDVGSINIRVGKKDLGLEVVTWADNPDQGDGLPLYDEHALISFRGNKDEFWFINVPIEFQTRGNRLALSLDGLLCLGSGMGGAQELTELWANSEQLSLAIQEQTNGGQVYVIKITAVQLAAKSPKVGYFRVTSVTVSEK